MDSLAIPVCGLEIILPTAFKLSLKQESIGLVEMGEAESSLRSKLAYGLFCLLACHVGVRVLYFQPRNKVDAGPEV